MISNATIQFSNEEKAKFKVAFEMFDANNDGTIDISELNDVMKSLGESITDSRIDSRSNEVQNNLRSKTSQ